MDKTKLAKAEQKAFKWLKDKGYDRKVCKDVAPILASYGLEQLTIPVVSKSFALGKEAIIVECFKGHEFEDGEVVEIVEKFDNELWIAKSKATGKEWYITEEEANVC